MTGISGKYRLNAVASKKLQQSKMHLNVAVPSETRLGRGTSLFT